MNECNVRMEEKSEKKMRRHFTDCVLWVEVE